ncbi:conserved hypothetical protein [Candidatus Methylobacter favarea]|uniref:Prepilin-type N-terminal cleavage/methylation domain-containing protein n=1 Tax=Candidatus Methylobacter favarea TaxID=2707345 RepID=A0A8S0WLZ1_9GAMM|nr:prepilin-type N-terminal cleavage/methylation domain-containing protein [Candidatus Methylobacter favarea]CAA9892960.1 conserved hypothetical protein [Candidatus Methylobacter favarea]
MNITANLKAMKYKQRGFTLIELLISMVIGLIVLAAVLGMFVTMIKSDNDNLKSIRLNQELRSAMSLITRDLRRSGYNGAAAAAVMAGNNPFQDMKFDILTPPINNATCVTYTYDADNDGVDDGNSERFGFRLNGGAIESRESGENCAGATNWDNITDENLVQINAFIVKDSPTTSAGITTHQITITLRGQLVRDNSVTRTISEIVEIRNDEY